ncbi:hypothetical protein EDB85DRAFT_1898701 [Lactarius pseudohatsudake]|nr:hypothetical protein EDB85DRAFT_1898701 [Lactarius pseudohatsudake]
MYKGAEECRSESFVLQARRCKCAMRGLILRQDQWEKAREKGEMKGNRKARRCMEPSPCEFEGGTRRGDARPVYDLQKGWARGGKATNGHEDLGGKSRHDDAQQCLPSPSPTAGAAFCTNSKGVLRVVKGKRLSNGPETGVVERNRKVLDRGSGDANRAMKGGLRQSFRGVGIEWHHTSVQSQDSASVDEGYCMVSEPYSAGSAYELFARGLVAVGKAMGWVSECVQRVSQNKEEGTIEIDARKGAQVKLFFSRSGPPPPTPPPVRDSGSAPPLI